MAANPNLTMAQAFAQAKKDVPSVAAAAKAPVPKAVTPNRVSDNKTASLNRQGYAEGGPTVAMSPVIAGPVRGPGSGTSDSILASLPVGGPARLSDGEHIVTDAEVKAAPGGHGYLEAFRAGLRAGRPFLPQPRSATLPGYRFGGPAPAAAVFTFRPVLTLPTVPGYAGGGPALATQARGIDQISHRSVTVNVGTITNAVPEPASDSLYRQVRKAVDGDEK